MMESQGFSRMPMLGINHELRKGVGSEILNSLKQIPLKTKMLETKFAIVT